MTLILEKKRTTALYLNIATVILELTAICIRPGSELPMIAYYTVISNLIALFSSVLFIITYFSGHLKRFAAVMRFTAAMMLVITFLMCALVLAWFVDPVHLLFYRSNSLNHVVLPVLTLISYLFFEEHISRRSEILPAFVITILYSAVMLVLNACGIADGPYPFFMTRRFGWGRVLLYCMLILIVMLPIAWGLFAIPKKLQRKMQEA